ncbi:TIR domain containing protein, partial [Parasponia andersonii]
MAVIASSSSCSSDAACSDKYDVFISFRGEDTRKSFTSHLYAAFCRKKIKAYIDEYSLEKGDQISHALLKAIQESILSVVIFSKDFASSTWCLDELVHILKCNKERGQSVIPIFYGVDPSHIRKQKEKYAAAFVAHEERFKDNMEKVKEWRDALTAAANISGFDSRDGSESKLIEMIVECALKKLNRIPSTVNDFKDLVGMDKRVEEVENLLFVGSSSVRTVGIWGMGGI